MVRIPKTQIALLINSCDKNIMFLGMFIFYSFHRAEDIGSHTANKPKPYSYKGNRTFILG